MFLSSSLRVSRTAISTSSRYPFRMATQLLSSVKFFDQAFVLDGSVTPQRLRELQSAGIKSVLSVAGETPGDPWLVSIFCDQ